MQQASFNIDIIYIYDFVLFFSTRNQLNVVNR